MAVRRSARLRSSQEPVEVDLDLPTQSNTNQNNANNTKTRKNLDTVMEREELPIFPSVPKTDPASAPIVTTHTPKAQTPKAHTPKAHTPKVHTPKAAHFQKVSPTKTPTMSATRPKHHEMHPSKVHQTTTKKPDSGLILGFNPIKKDAQGNIVKDTPAHNTPSKTNPSPASYYGTPAFDFKFSAQDSQLSNDAKRLMESLRQDVAQNKQQLIHEKATQASGSSQNTHRKIAKPTGKATRFSDAHMAEFKKMDSIAGHASAFRATPGRFQPIQKTLKRTNSKASLDESESQTSPARASPKECTPTTPSAKRVKHEKPNIASTSRLTNPKPTASRPRVGVRSSLLTPTRSSMARASVSLKPPQTTMVPSFTRSPFSKPAEAPSTPRTEFNPRFKSNIPTLSSMKSILRPHQPLFSKDPTKIASGTHKAALDFTPDLLLQPSRETSHEPAPTPSPKKKVEFTPCTRPRHTEEFISPSPSKIPTRFTFSSTADVVYPTLPALTPERASAQSPTTMRSVRLSEAPVVAALPEIPGMPHGISHKKRHRAVEDKSDTENVPPADHAEERSAKRVKANTPAPKKGINSSPLKHRSHTPLRSGPASRTGTPASTRHRNRMLSMGRLNMLAQPKSRS